MKPEYLFLSNAHPNSEHLKETNTAQDTRKGKTIGHLKSLTIEHGIDWIKGNMIDTEFMTTEDKALFNRVYRDLTGDTYK